MAGHTEAVKKIVQKKRAQADSTGSVASAGSGNPVNFFGLPREKLRGVLEASGVDSTTAGELVDEALGPKTTANKKIVGLIKKIIRRFMRKNKKEPDVLLKGK